MKKRMYALYLLGTLALPLLSKEEPNPIAVGVEDDPIYLEKFLQPWEFSSKEGDVDELVEFEFENSELSSFISYIEQRFGLTFILDNALSPMPKDGKSPLGAKITFKTHRPFSKQEAWSIFLTFLDMAGLSTVPGPTEGVYRITTTDPKSSIGVDKGPLPSFIGVHQNLLPDNDSHIRYVYFAKNTSLDTIRTILDSIKSVTAPNLIIFPEVRGIIITDKAYNIKVMLELLEQIDQVAMPESMSVFKLKKTDAMKVAKFYADIAKDDAQDKTLAARFIGGKKQQTMNYFAPGTRVIPEPRTNSLIILGSAEAVKKVEEFIRKEVDREIDLMYTPIHVYPLKYVQAEAIADIINTAVQFQADSAAAQAGGVRDGDKYFKPVSIVPEKSGNRLIITADYEEYLKIYEVIKKLDVEQPQVALKVLILSLSTNDARQLGVQLRNKKPGVDGLLSNNVNFQTSGLAGISNVVENPNGGGATRLLGDLVALATGGAVGSTFITLGSDCYGVWGMLQMLQTYSQTNVISNPFLVTTNNYPAEVSLGEVRRVTTGTTVGGGSAPVDSFDDLPAKITVFVTPTISYEGFITLSVIVQDNQFTDLAAASGNRIEREIATSVILPNNGILALGGVMQDTYTDVETGVPVLKDLPLVGWLFKNKQKTVNKSSIIVLISPEIIPVADSKFTNEFTAQILKDAENVVTATDTKTKELDPIQRWFFNESINDSKQAIDNFVAKEERYLHPALKNPREALNSTSHKRLSDYL